MLKKIIIWTMMCFIPCLAHAKQGDDQNQIILLNDSAAALEDINPALSKELTRFADEKEKVWEARNANKNLPPPDLTAQDKAMEKEQIKLVEKAAGAIGSTYPLITQGLKRMAREMQETIKT